MEGWRKRLGSRQQVRRGTVGKRGGGGGGGGGGGAEVQRGRLEATLGDQAALVTGEEGNGRNDGRWRGGRVGRRDEVHSGGRL